MDHHLALQGVEVSLLGAEGATVMPEWDGPLGAFAAAIDALLDAARTGVAHPCDVRFGVRVTELLADAEAQLGRA
ncbi:hypothetical protein [Streptomyces hundungensis]|uniref:hypothetical protein n=1 Tax=Streptomyces hundungensis TaxID=1077946 RepID=UPI003F5411FE